MRDGTHENDISRNKGKKKTTETQIKSRKSTF